MPQDFVAHNAQPELQQRKHNKDQEWKAGRKAKIEKARASQQKQAADRMAKQIKCDNRSRADTPFMRVQFCAALMHVAAVLCWTA